MIGRCKRCGFESPVIVLERSEGFCEGCEYVGTVEAAARLGVTWRTIHKYLERGTLKAVKLPPRLLRIKRADVEALLS